MSRSPLIEHIILHKDVLIQTDYVRDLWMIPDRLEATEQKDKDTFVVSTKGLIYKGKLFVFDKMFYAIKTYTRTDDRTSDIKIYTVTATHTNIPYNPDDLNPLCAPTDKFILSPHDIINAPSKPIETTVGRFIANYLFLVYPFGDKIPYLNETFSTDKLESLIKIPLLKGEISIEDTKSKYVNSLSLFGQANEMICPNITEKTITIPPHIPKLLEKLVKENHEALEAGDSTVMSDIEKTVIKAYKDYLKGDPSMDFLLKGKYFNVVLKKLFLTQGMVELFGQPGKFKFIANPMGNGWKVEDLPYIFDEVRQGSYARAVETADGGVIAKLILRVLQDTRINIPDCKTKVGEHIHATKDQLKDLLWNYVINDDGSESLIDEQSLSSFEGKDIVVRTPGYCQAPDGYCSRCFGYVFEELGQEAFAPIANDFARNQTTASLKSMHGKSYDAVELGDLNGYLV